MKIDILTIAATAGMLVLATTADAEGTSTAYDPTPYVSVCHDIRTAKVTGARWGRIWNYLNCKENN